MRRTVAAMMAIKAVAQLTLMAMTVNFRIDHRRVFLISVGYERSLPNLGLADLGYM